MSECNPAHLFARPRVGIDQQTWHQEILHQLRRGPAHALLVCGEPLKDWQLVNARLSLELLKLRREFRMLQDVLRHRRAPVLPHREEELGQHRRVV